ncbi:MAG: dephospho-CoA kinase [Acidobacteriota bacterium]|nr:dephospho-CoA kinase [Acidobacteriota bacterium]
MRRIALAGGIGAGKSTAQRYLEQRGFSVIDADDVARAVVAPGQPAYTALRDAFGDAILAADGTLDRAFLAEVVFHDPSALARLNAITHPRVGEEILARLAAAERDGESVVFIALPLFRPEHRALFALDSAWSIEVAPEVALDRLVESRHLSREDATARLGAQMSNEERRALVDHVVVNDGTPEELVARLEELLRIEGLDRG